MHASIVERQGIMLETAGHREEREIKEEKDTEKRATRVGVQKGMPKEEERVHPREDVLLVVDRIGQVNVQKEKEKESMQ